jgi:glycosyltransferase involved in cell wall biosynthesis
MQPNAPSTLAPNRPAVSVIVPAYRVTAYIAEAVESVLRQTRQDHEILVVNDGCPDTENLEKALAPYRSGIRYIAQSNGGPGAARNRGLREAAGRYIALLDGDDRWMPAYMEKQLGWMERDEALDLLYPNSEVFGGGPRDGTLLRGPGEWREPATIDSLVEGTNVVNNVAMFKKEIAVRAGGWDPEMRHAEDFDLWLRIAARGGKILYNPQVLAGYRIRPGSQTGNPAAMYGGQIRTCQKALRNVKVTARQRELLEWRIAWATAGQHLVEGKRALASGDTAAARAHFRQAFPHAGSNKLRAIQAGLYLFPAATAALVKRFQLLSQGKEPICVESPA